MADAWSIAEGAGLDMLGGGTTPGLGPSIMGGGIYGGGDGTAGGILNPGGIFTPPATQTPNISKVGRDFTSLMGAYLNDQPAIYQNEATYAPQYAALKTNIAAGLAPGIMRTMRAYNPSATGILDTLGSQASEQLKTNGGLDPALQTRLEQNVRGAEAARGMGNGPGDVAQETNFVTQTQEARRMANQQFAGNVAGQEGNYYRDPFTVAAGMGTTPSLISPQQSDSMLGTVYNAGAAANISTANNTAAADSY